MRTGVSASTTRSKKAMCTGNMVGKLRRSGTVTAM